MPHDHGAALDAASHYNELAAAPVTRSTNDNQHIVHSLVDALSQKIKLASTHKPASLPPMRMPEISDLVELKSRLCIREG